MPKLVEQYKKRNWCEKRLRLEGDEWGRGQKIVTFVDEDGQKFVWYANPRAEAYRDLKNVGMYRFKVKECIDDVVYITFVKKPD